MNQTHVQLWGISLVHDPDRLYGDEIIEGLNKVWPAVSECKTTGINHVVYDANNEMFVGVELVDGSSQPQGLTKRQIHIDRAIHHRHIGPYNKLPQIHESLRIKVLEKQGIIKYPILEVYGHWNNDENKLETDVYYSID